MKLMILLLLVLALAINSRACTDFKFAFQYQNETCIASGRSMDYPIPQGSMFLIVNQNTFFQSTAPTGSGISWNTKYGYLGATALTNHTIVDGMNEVGLTCGILMLDSTIYPMLNPSQYKQALEAELICPYALGNFGTVKDLAIGLKKVFVWQNPFIGGSPLPPVHFQFHDALGQNLVLEFLNGTMILYDNPIGVMTNDPPLPFHWENLKQYNGLSQFVPANTYVNGYLINGAGVTLGTLGLPGDSSPISRYVRIAKEIGFMEDKNGYIQSKTYLDGINAGIHLLHKVDVLYGEAMFNFLKKERADISYWQVIRDSTNKIFYYFTYYDVTVRFIDLNSIDFSTGNEWNKVFLGSPRQQQVFNVTNQFA